MVSHRKKLKKREMDGNSGMMGEIEHVKGDWRGRNLATKYNWIYLNGCRKM